MGRIIRYNIIHKYKDVILTGILNIDNVTSIGTTTSDYSECGNSFLIYYNECTSNNIIAFVDKDENGISSANKLLDIIAIFASGAHSYPDVLTLDNDMVDKIIYSNLEGDELYDYLFKRR